jgi:DNA-binding beta-propeller fold protein YncE
MKLEEADMKPYLQITLSLILSSLIISVFSVLTKENQSEIIKLSVDYVPGVGRVVSSVPLDTFPQSLHAGQEAIWYWFEECGCIVKLDPTNATSSKLQIGNGKSGPYGNPKDLTLDTHIVWVTDAGNFSVVGFDRETQEIIKEIPLSLVTQEGTKRFRPFGLATDGKDLWVSDFDGNTVIRVDLETGKIIAEISNISHPAGIAISPEAIWVVEHRSGNIVRIDPATNTIVEKISINVQANPTWSPACGMCINHVVVGQNAIWVPLNRGRGVAQIDPQTNKVKAIISINDMPVHQLAISENAIWAVGSSVGEDCELNPSGLVKIDPQTNTIVGTLPIPCAYSIAVYENKIWVGFGFPGAQGQLIQIEPD